MTGKKYLKTYKKVKASMTVRRVLIDGETEKAYSLRRIKNIEGKTWIPKSVCIRVKEVVIEEETWTDLGISKWFYKQERLNLMKCEYGR
jgi:hypothetical protein